VLGGLAASFPFGRAAFIAVIASVVTSLTRIPLGGRQANPEYLPIMELDNTPPPV
jgi:hypothetical protein